MILEEIKKAVDDSFQVHWKNDGYIVIKNSGDYLVCFTANNSCIGLTWKDNKTMNGQEQDFYIGKA